MDEDKLREAEVLLHIYELYSADSMVDALIWCIKAFKAENLKDFEKLYPVGSDGRKRFYRVGNFLSPSGRSGRRSYFREGKSGMTQHYSQTWSTSTKK